MSELYEYIGQKIREFRQEYHGKGLSQEALAEAMGKTANTISRWETATYKPSAVDLHELARFFSVDISVFFPGMQPSHIQALMSATGDLGEEEIDDLIQYARFRKARQQLKDAKGKKEK